MTQYIITMIVGAGMIILALNILHKQTSIKKTGLIADGIVYDFLKDPTSSFNIRYPIIRFLTQKHEWVTETFNIGIFSGFYKRGQKVTVFYNKEDPKKFIIDSKTDKLIIYIILIAGIFLILLGAFNLIRIEL